MLWRVIKGVGTGRIIAFVLLAFLLALRITDPIPVQQSRLAAFDVYQQTYPRSPQPAPVTILDIDDASLETFGQWPWPRSRMAELIDRTFEAGAVAMAFDIVFAEPDRLSPSAVARDTPQLEPDLRRRLSELPDNDVVLAAAIARGRVVLGQTSVRSAQTSLNRPDTITATPHALIGDDARPFLQRFPDLVQNLPILEEAAAGRGVFSVRPDPDGIYRRLPVALLVQDQLRLGLASELLRVATGGDAFGLRGNAAGADGVIVGGQLIRTAADGTVWPYLSRSDPGRFVSAADLLTGQIQDGRMRGQLVLVGTSAIGLEDYRATPLGQSMAGVEVHAQMLENVLTNSLLVRPNYAIGVELVAAITLPLLVIALVPVLGARLILVFSVVVLTGYIGGGFLLFRDHRILLDPTWPALCTLATIMVMTTANYLREERDRQRIRGAFGQYVSPDLVEKLSHDPDALVLGGEERDLTLLFSDIRGFTSLAESQRHDPQGLTELMNSFLTVMSQAVLDEGGTIDKFMGDAVMAFWNAPLDVPNHPLLACRAALRMQVAVNELNDERAEHAAQRGQEIVPIRIGIGLNTGPCIVGNMGSMTRFDYTALGDTVNLASRLEGQSKPYGVLIILGQATAVAVSEKMATLELDQIRVKGKSQPERVFGLFGDEALKASDAFKTLEAANARMRDAYTKQDWSSARTALADVEQAAEAGQLDLSGYVACYESRLTEYEAVPPTEGWDGVHKALQK